VGIERLLTAEPLQVVPAYFVAVPVPVQQLLFGQLTIKEELNEGIQRPGTTSKTAELLVLATQLLEEGVETRRAKLLAGRIGEISPVNGHQCCPTVGSIQEVPELEQEAGSPSE